MRKVLTFLTALIVGTAAYGSDSAVYSAKPIDVLVVDADTREPLEGVYVAALWELRGGMNYGDTVGFVNVLETRTGKNGEFHFDGWGPRTAKTGRVRFAAPLLFLFKKGYRVRSETNNGPIVTNAPETLTSDWNGKILTLERFRGTPTEHKETFELLRGYILVLSQLDQLKQLPQFMCAVVGESDQLAGQGVPNTMPSRDWLRERGGI